MDIEFERVSGGIWRLRGTIDTENQTWEPGWYFVDETDDFQGPYKTRKATEVAMETYINWLQG